MSDNIIQLNEALIKHDLKDLVRSSVEETLNALLDHEADELVNASKYERTENLSLSVRGSTVSKTALDSSVVKRIQLILVLFMKR